MKYEFMVTEPTKISVSVGVDSKGDPYFHMERTPIYFDVADREISRLIPAIKSA